MRNSGQEFMKKPLQTTILQQRRFQLPLVKNHQHCHQFRVILRPQISLLAQRYQQKFIHSRQSREHRQQERLFLR